MPKTEPNLSIQNRTKFFLKQKSWFWVFSGLILGRVVILGELHPFLPTAAALLAVFLPWKNGLWALAALELSLALVSSGAERLSSGIAAGAVYGLILVWKRKRKVGAWMAGAIAGSGCLLFKAVILNNTGYYHLLNLLFEALLAAVLTCVLFKLPAAILAIRLRRSLTGEELISLFIWAAALVVGCGNLELVGLKIGEILSQVLILLAAFIGGAGLGAAAGAAVGVLPLLISLPLASGSMAFCGLLAGLGQGWGKKAVLAGLVLAQMVLWAYNGVDQEVLWRMGETLLAVGIFLLLPTQKITGLAGWSQGLPQRFSPEAERQIRLASQESLQAFGRLGQKIASLWLEDSSAKLALDHQIIQREVRNKVCLDCGMLRVCWKDTWFRFADFLEAFRRSEESFVHYDQLPLEIQQRCLRSREIALLLACLQDNFQVSRFWQNKLKNCRRFLKEQLEIIGEIWDNRLARLDFSTQTGEQAESFCKQLLRDNGFPALQVEIFNQQQGAEIAITAKGCGQNSLCRYQAAAILSRLFNRTYQVAGDWCYLEEGSHCRFWLAPELKFYWQVGAAQKSLNGVCGDSYGFLYLPGGRLAAVLSDGMGQGEKAYRQSRSVVEMLGEFLKFGFSAQEALRTVNSLLLLRPEQESFATVDLVLLDLYSGEAEFLKIASPPAYLLRGEQVSQLKGNSLPVGIISDVTAAVTIKKLRDRDYVVLFTDGLLNKMGEDEWLQAALPELGNLSPSQGAELLLELAEQNWGASDDRTVLILKIKEYR